jgi:hypothetical protein
MNIEEAEYANDVHADVDFAVATKVVDVTFTLSSHAKVTRTEANDLRTAFLSGGWSNLRAAWATIDSRSTAWLDGMPQPVRDALIYQVSSRGPLPPVP